MTFFEFPVHLSIFYAFSYNVFTCRLHFLRNSCKCTGIWHRHDKDARNLETTIIYNVGRNFLVIIKVIPQVAIKFSAFDFYGEIFNTRSDKHFEILNTKLVSLYYQTTMYLKTILIFELICLVCQALI